MAVRPAVVIAKSATAGGFLLGDKVMAEPIRDPDNYAAMSVPFGSSQAAQDAIEAFWAECYELRNKHRIADLVLIYCLPLPEGRSLISLSSMGNSEKVLPMVARTFGHLKANAIAEIDRDVAAGAALPDIRIEAGVEKAE